MKRILLVAVIVILIIVQGCTLASVNVEVLSERTALENQILGTYNALDREMLREAQTPQAFSAPLIRDAHRRACADGIEGTDDAVLVESLGEAVAVIEGDPENLKVTPPVDPDLARVLLGRRAGDRSH